MGDPGQHQQDGHEHADGGGGVAEQGTEGQAEQAEHGEIQAGADDRPQDLVLAERGRGGVAVR